MWRLVRWVTNVAGRMNSDSLDKPSEERLWWTINGQCFNAERVTENG